MNGLLVYGPESKDSFGKRKLWEKIKWGQERVIRKSEEEDDEED